jgi:hypothetical protein
MQCLIIYFFINRPKYFVPRLKTLAWTSDSADVLVLYCMYE